MTEFKKTVLELVSKIPKGKVVSYGNIAKKLGMAKSARVVGYIMMGLNPQESKEYPWHRVVDRNGFISSSKLGERGLAQEALLKAEGIEVTEFQIQNPARYWFEFL